MVSSYDTPMWRRRAEMRRQGMSIKEIARADGVKPQSIAKGFQRMRYLGLQVPTQKQARSSSMQLVGVDASTYGALSDMAGRYGLGTAAAIRLILRTVAVDHPTIAVNILDEEA